MTKALGCVTLAQFPWVAAMRPPRKARHSLPYQQQMNAAILTVLVALAAALFLVMRTEGRARGLAALALLAAGAEAWLVFRNIESQHIHLVIVQPIALLGAGGLLWLMNESKPAVTAATLVTLVGAIRLVVALSLG